MRQGKQNTANADLRQKIVAAGFFNWQIARRCNVDDSTFSRWLREPLPEGDERRKRILQVLADMEGGGDGKKKEVDGTTV